MALNCSQLRSLIIEPALKSITVLNLYSENAVELLIMTMAHESNLGMYFAQVKGPALGIYNMEGRTYNDIWDLFLNRHPPLALDIVKACRVQKRPDPEDMNWNFRLATLMARIFYLRVTELLPDHNDVEAMGRYCKKYWNTEAGKATVDDYVNAYKKMVGAKAL